MKQFIKDFKICGFNIFLTIKRIRARKAQKNAIIGLQMEALKKTGQLLKGGNILGAFLNQFYSDCQIRLISFQPLPDKYSTKVMIIDKNHLTRQKLKLALEIAKDKNIRIIIKDYPLELQVKQALTGWME